jgi:hypothetical protein
MDKRYQVFVSSTYEDLQKERQEVMQALLELDCIPSGMELFPAADEDQWTLIKSIIDDCDYYIVIIGGRYGSTDPEGVSYTEKEYRHALESGKPIIGFLHKDPEELPAKRTEKTEAKKEKLGDFRELAKKKMCQFWDSPSDLGSKVSRSMMKLIKLHPGIGWVRADLLPSESVNQELLNLRKQVDELNSALEDARTSAPKGTDSFSQDDDQYEAKFSIRRRKDEMDFSGTRSTGKVRVTWNEIFYSISPLMINEATESTLSREINKLIEDKIGSQIRKRFSGENVDMFQIHDEHFKTIIVQLRALGLITKSMKNRSVKDKATHWKLTPYGDGVMTKLRAIKRTS